MKTILEVARENNVSKTAIIKRINKLGIKNKLTKQGNKYLINAKYESLIIQGLQGYTETEAETTQETDNPVNALIQQLSEKDKQIERLQTMIAKLQDELSVNNQILLTYRREKQLTIETKTDEEPKKPSFFERLGLRKKNSDVDRQQDKQV